MDRKSSTFEVSQRERATLWAILEGRMRTEKRKRGRLGPVWSEVLRNEYGRHQARPIDLLPVSWTPR